MSRLNRMIRTKLEPVATKVNTTSTKLNTVSSKLDTTSSKVDTTSTKVGTIETKLSTVETNLGTVTTKVGTVESNLSTAKTELTSAINAAPAVTAKAVARRSVYKDISSTFKITTSINVGTSGVQIKTYTNTSGKDKVVTFMFYCNIDGTSGAAVLGVLPGDVNISTNGTEVYDRPVALATGADAPDECLILSWNGVLPAGHKLCLVLTSATALKNHYENLSLSGDGWFNPNGVPHVCHVVLYNE